MIFNSLAFFYFFIIVTALFFLLRHRYRWMLLLAASCYFYMYFIPIYILILGFTIVIDYFAGIFIAKSQGRRRKWWLILSLVANIGVLAFFKYYNFLNDNLSDILKFFHYPNPIPYLNILLPLGLSFHTFQAMSYTIEVYRGNQKPEKHFGIYALYVMFYPQLVAGPIERPQNIIHQFREQKYFEYNRVVDGLKIMMWGFIKKLMIANRISLYVDTVYANPQRHGSLSLWTAAFLFIIQIYCDFSGYSDIAIGAAKVMGYDLMTNFKRPFCSKSIRETWQRWHISLTSWFRDYLYFSMGGSRRGLARTLFNLIFVFFISGLWHGASWTFIIWGVFNGVFLALEQALNPVLKNVHKMLGSFKNFFRIAAICVFFTVAGVFFRATNLHSAKIILTSMLTFKRGHFFHPGAHLEYAVIGTLLLLISDFVEEFNPKIKILRNKNIAVRYTGYVCLIALLLMIGVFEESQFIYFQF